MRIALVPFALTVLVMMFAAPAWSADDAGKGESPAAAKPPEAKPAADTDPGDPAVHAARKFLLAVGAGDDKAAYEMASPKLRETAHTLEQFAKLMTAVRGATDLSFVQPV